VITYKALERTGGGGRDNFIRVWVRPSASQRLGAMPSFDRKSIGFILNSPSLFKGEIIFLKSEYSCYRPSVFTPLKMFRYDFHILNGDA